MMRSFSTLSSRVIQIFVLCIGMAICKSLTVLKNKVGATVDRKEFCVDHVSRCLPLANPCRNNATCYMAEPACVAQCNCAAGFYGELCEHRLVETIPTQTMAGLLRGKLPTSVSFEEVLRERRCYRLKSSLVPCEGHGRCLTKEREGKIVAYCHCDPGWKGETCDMILEPKSEEQRADANDRKISNRLSDHTHQKRIDIAFVRLPRAGPRDECPDIDRMVFSCRGHGRCYTQVIDGFNIPRCLCDKGWTGLLCHEKDPRLKNVEPKVYAGIIPDVESSTSDVSTTHSPDPSTDLNNITLGSRNKSFSYTNDSTTFSLNEFTTILNKSEEQNHTSGRDVCDGISKDNFSCLGRGRCFIEVSEGMVVPACDCDDIWTGRYCQVPCSKKCLNGGWCKFINLKPVCSCMYGYEGSHCEKIMKNVTRELELRTRYVTEHRGESWVVIGTVVGLSIFLMLLGVAALVILWRKRALVIMKLMYHFQRYEDNDDKEYDAFISYKSSSRDYTASPEEMFVIETLLPKLEREMGFRICVHFKDFIPGLSISDNVLYAIQNSRRTIMLVSRAYITESMWCKFEYQQAQVAMLEQKQRIIPILYEDISDVDISDTMLKVIMQSITYLEKPQDMTDTKKVDHFWARVCLSMPKKRALPGAVELTWQESCESAATQTTTISGERTSVHSDDTRKSIRADSGIDCTDLLSSGTEKCKYTPPEYCKYRCDPESGILKPENCRSEIMSGITEDKTRIGNPLSQHVPMRSVNEWLVDDYRNQSTIIQ